RQRIVAGLGERGRMKFAFARRRPEPAVGEWRVRFRHVEAYESARLDRVPVETASERMVLLERMTRNRLVVFSEARVVEAHPRGERAEDVGVRPRLAERRDRRIVRLRV